MGEICYISIPENPQLLLNSSQDKEIDVEINKTKVAQYSTKEKKISIDYKSKKAGCFEIDVLAKSEEQELKQKILVFIYPQKCKLPASAYVVVNEKWEERKGRKIEIAFMGNDKNVDEYMLGITNNDKYLTTRETSGKLLEFYAKTSGIFKVNLFAKNLGTNLYEDLQSSFSFYLENLLPIINFDLDYKKTQDGSIETGAELLLDLSESYDKDGEITKYQVDFGEGLGAIEQTTPKFKWSYSSPGDYQIEISIFDKSGSTTHSTKISAIGEKKAKAFFEMKDTIFYTGDILPLDAIKSSPSRFASIVDFRWEICWDKEKDGFDNNSWDELAAGQQVNQIINWVNNAKIKLTIEDSRGDISNYEKILFVENKRPSITKETIALDSFVTYSGSFRYKISSSLPSLLGEKNNLDRYVFKYNYFPQHYNNYFEFKDSFTVNFKQPSESSILVKIIDKYTDDVIYDEISLNIKDLGLRAETSIDNSISSPFLVYMENGSEKESFYADKTCSSQMREITNNFTFPIEVFSDCKKIERLAIAECSYKIDCSDEIAFYYGRKHSLKAYEFLDEADLYKTITTNFNYHNSSYCVKENAAIVKAVYSSGAIRYFRIPYYKTEGVVSEALESLLEIKNNDPADNRNLHLNAYSNELYLGNKKIASVKGYDINNVCNFRLRIKAFKSALIHQDYIDTIFVNFKIGESKKILSHDFIKELLLKYGKYSWEIGIEWQSKKWAEDKWILAYIFDDFLKNSITKENVFLFRIENLTAERIIKRLDKKNAIHRSFKSYSYKTKFSESTFKISHEFLTIEKFKENLVVMQTSGCFRLKDKVTLINEYYDNENQATLEFRLPGITLPDVDVPGKYYYDESAAIYSAWAKAESFFQVYEGNKTIQWNNFEIGCFLKNYQQDLLNSLETDVPLPENAQYNTLNYISNLEPAESGYSYKKDWKYKVDIGYLSLASMFEALCNDYGKGMFDYLKVLENEGITETDFSVKPLWEDK